MTTSDKELMSPKDDERMLLELAAKVAGITPINVTEDGVVYGESVMECDFWNPLTDDGDALRLAVKLGIDVASDIAGQANANDIWEFHCDNNDDPYAATRRAIVRAAAAIGEKL